MRARAFTLVELLITITVAGLLLAFALPSFEKLVAGQRSAAALNQMVGAVNLARSLAITSGRVVTLCPARAGACLGRNQWHQGALVFIDEDRNGRLDGDERIERMLPPLEDGERIYWRSFRSRSYLQFHPRGYTAWQNGSFLYCAPDGDPDQIRMIIINIAGRARAAQDADGDGIVEDSRGRPLRCP